MSLTYDEAFRGRVMPKLVAMHMQSNTRTILEPGELRLKQSIWDWFSRLSPQDLERVRCRPPLEAVFAGAVERLSPCGWLTVNAALRTRFD